MSIQISIALGVLALYVYYELRERLTLRADPQRSIHPAWIRKGIRLLVFGAVVLLAAQGFGLLPLLPLPAPERARVGMRVAGTVIFWASTVLLLWARETLGVHWAHGADAQIIPGQALVTTGPYRYIRHPIYLALALLFFGAELAYGSWLILGTIPIAVDTVWQARREEELLRQTFGIAYDRYVERAGLFLPRVQRLFRG